MNAKEKALREDLARGLNERFRYLSAGKIHKSAALDYLLEGTDLTTNVWGSIVERNPIVEVETEVERVKLTRREKMKFYLADLGVLAFFAVLLSLPSGYSGVPSYIQESPKTALVILIVSIIFMIVTTETMTKPKTIDEDTNSEHLKPQKLKNIKLVGDLKD